MSIGARIRQLRDKNGLSGERFGELCDVSKGTVSHWESDSIIPPVPKLIELKKHINFSLDWLIFGDKACQPEAEYKVLTPDSIQQAAIRLLSEMDVDDANQWLDTIRNSTNKARRSISMQILSSDATTLLTRINGASPEVIETINSLLTAAEKDSSNKTRAA